MVTLCSIPGNSARPARYAARAASAPPVLALQARPRLDVARLAGLVGHDQEAVHDPELRQLQTALLASATSNEFRSVELSGDHMYFAKDWLPPACHIDQIAYMIPTSACEGVRS